MISPSWFSYYVAPYLPPQVGLFCRAAVVGGALPEGSTLLLVGVVSQRRAGSQPKTSSPENLEEVLF